MENAISSFPLRQHHKISVSGLISTFFFSKKMLCIIITRERCTKNLKMGFFTPSPTATICDKKCASHYNSLSCKNYPLLVISDHSLEALPSLKKTQCLKIIQKSLVGRSQVSTGCFIKFWSRILQKNYKWQKWQKIAKVCLHPSQALQISVQFDDFFDKKNYKL